MPDTPTYPKRLIEVDLPIRRISAHARREKSIRHGHISTLHIWWARRPLAACRAVLCAALWPDPADPLCPESFRQVAKKEMRAWATCHMKLLSLESYTRFNAIAREAKKVDDLVELRRALLDFIADFANWDNSTIREYLDTSRALTMAAHEALGGEPGTRPLVVDPFAGGGAIPLEALRIGSDAFAGDLNPVPVLLNKVVLEYIPRFGQELADRLHERSAWILQEAKRQLSDVYPGDDAGSAPVAFLWARTIRCEGPGCGANIPLLRTTVLTKKAPVTHVAVRAEPDKSIAIEVRSGEEQSSTATVRSGKATCPVCGYSTPEKRVKEQTVTQRGGANSARLFAVLVQGPHGRHFRTPLPLDRDAVETARKRFEQLSLRQPDLFPSEPINPLRPYKNTVGVCIVTRMGIRRFVDLYSARQALAIATIQELITRARTAVPIGSKELDDAVTTLAFLALDRLVMQNSSLSRWNTARSTIEGLFSKQALQVVWDYAESNPIGDGMANWSGATDWIEKVIEANTVLVTGGTSVHSAAAELPLPDDSADLVFTDPPYFAAIPYADLSDVFYVWLRRSLSEIHPALFRNGVVAKAEELVVTNSARGPNDETKDSKFFETGMARALGHARLILRPEGVGCVVFADASTTAWEAMLGAVLSAGWVATASWPIDTEMQSRTRAHTASSLQSSVFLVCRPRENPDGSVRTDDVGDWREALRELPRRIHDWMPRLAQEGVVGADAIFACLGPALEVFSRYSRVEKTSGEVVTLKEYLEHVWAAVSKEALSMIFRDAETSGLEPDARLTAMWLWTLAGPAGTSVTGSTGEEAEADEDEDAAPRAKTVGFTLEFDAARKIAQGLGARLDELTSVVEVKGDKARLLSIGERAKALFAKAEKAAAVARKKGSKQKQMNLFEEEIGQAAEEQGWDAVGAPEAGRTTLDRVHQAMLLFGTGRGEALKRFLVEEGVGRQAPFWKLAQALSALYPAGCDEKRWVDGVLARKKGLGF